MLVYKLKSFIMIKMISLNTLIIIIIIFFVLAIGAGAYFLIFKKKKAPPIKCKQLDDPCTNNKECCGSGSYSMYCNNTSKTCTKCGDECKNPSECCEGKQCIGGTCQSPPKVCGTSGSSCSINNYPSQITVNKGDKFTMAFPLASSNCKYMFFSDKSLHYYMVKVGSDISTASSTPSFFHMSYDPNYKESSFSDYMNVVFLSEDGDLIVSSQDFSSGNIEILWSLSSRNDGVWSRGSGPPYTLTLDDCGNLVLTDSSNNVTFNSKLRYFCDIDGTNCGWRTCNNNFRCGFTDDNKYWCRCV